MSKSVKYSSSILMSQSNDGRKNTTKKRKEEYKQSHLRRIHSVKDEFEFATNWRRVFMNIYQRLKWLNAFALINYIAMQKIIKKFVKTHFEFKDNVIDKGLLKYIQSKNMIHRENLGHLLDDLK